jgi:LysM repeat protein
VAHIAPAPQFSSASRRRIYPSHFLAPLALAGVIAAIVLVVNSASKASHPATTAARPQRHVPPYWKVRPGDTLTIIAHRTGLTVAQLRSFNPNVDPAGLFPGQRLNLWRHPPAPRHKPLGPQFWTVRSGQSFGSIAAKTKISITTLQHLNPTLKPSTLQPGDRVRLRR